MTNQLIIWKYCHGDSEIHTDYTGNTYIGKKAHDSVFEIKKLMREKNVPDIEFDNTLLLYLTKSPIWARTSTPLSWKNVLINT
jgi:hypothetical protein